MPRPTKSLSSLGDMTATESKVLNESPTMSVQTLSTTSRKATSSNQLYLPKTTEKDNQADNLPRMLQYMRFKDWSNVLRLLEHDPSLSRRNVKMVYEGENSICLLLHLFCSRRSVPFIIIDLLVTLNPAALLESDTQGARLPLHIATSSGMSEEIVMYLCTALPQALQYADRDGNYPLHYAAMYGSPATIRHFVRTFPQAAGSQNEKKRLPLHFLCSRFFDDDEIISPLDIEQLIKAYPQALKMKDRCGRLPLHLASEQTTMHWDHLNVLIKNFPSALVDKDEFEKTPLMHAKRRAVKNKEDHQSLISKLTECTLKEIRKEKPYLPSFMVNSTLAYSNKI